MRANTFSCQRQDCPRVRNENLRKIDCPKCGMPVEDLEAEQYILMFQRCKEWNALPNQGGIMSQPEEMMQAFDTISSIIEEHKRNQEHEMELEDQRRKVRGYA